MKKSLIILLLYFAINANATHLLSGQIAVKHISTIGPARTYEVSITMYRDCLNGQADFDDPMTMGIFSLNNNLLISNVDFHLSQRIRVSTNQPCIEQAIYVKNITVNEDFYITTSRCCRVYNINNIDPDLGTTIYTEVYTDLQGSELSKPVYNLPIITDIGKSLSFNLSSPDILSDSTTYEFSCPLQGGNLVNPLPAPTPKPYSLNLFNTGYNLSNPLGIGNTIVIDRNTGILTLKVNTQGAYAIGITVTKFKNGAILYKQVRDLTIIAGPGFTPLTVEHKEIKNSGLIIFPNPAGNILNVNLENYSSQGTITISIFNIEGKLMKKEILNTINSIDITNLEKGIYQIQVIIGDKISNSKFIKL